MARWVALLRGINVGGKNLIPMSALEAFFVAQGLSHVATYIQSGNVLFTSREPGGTLAARLEAGLSSAFGYPATVVLRTRAQLRRVVEGAPPGFGARPRLHRYDVAFLAPSLSASDLLARVPVRPGVDQASAGPGALYLSRRIAGASRSRLSRITSIPEYERMTIRTWRTATALLAMLEAPAAGGRGAPIPRPPKGGRSRRRSATRRSAASRT